MSSGASDSAVKTAEHAGEQQEGSESKSWTTAGSIYEALDENIINKNNFCIIIGAFVRKNAISPKSVNL